MKTRFFLFTLGLIATFTFSALAGPILPVKGTVQSVTDTTIVVKGPKGTFTLRRDRLPPKTARKLSRSGSKVNVGIMSGAISSIKLNKKQAKAASKRAHN